VTANQRLLLLNSSLIRRKLEQGPKLQPILRMRNRTPEATEALYLTLLARFPTDDERARVVAHLASRGTDSYGAFVDVAWALINSTEFLHRH
jgi:hypothetical protein